MRQGDELLRNGRTGAFVFSIGTLRNQAHSVALTVSQAVRRLFDGHGMNIHPEASEPFKDQLRCVTLDEAGYSAACATLSDLSQSSEFCEQLASQVGFPMRQPSSASMVSLQSIEPQLVRSGLPKDVASNASLLVLEELERRTVQELTDISRLAPEIQQRLSIRSPKPGGSLDE
jgi:hypothetical protein